MNNTDHDLRLRVREHMERTGQNYTTAKRVLTEEPFRGGLLGPWYTADDLVRIVRDHETLNPAGFRPFRREDQHRDRYSNNLDAVRDPAVVAKANLCADFLRIFTTTKAPTTDAYGMKHAAEQMFGWEHNAGHVSSGELLMAALLIGSPLIRPELSSELCISKPEWVFVRRRTRKGTWWGWEREKEPPRWEALAEKLRRDRMPLHTDRLQAGLWCDPNDEYVRRIRKP